MNTLMILALALAWVALLLVGWLGWQLLRQNGRGLSRLDELELGPEPEPKGLSVGEEAPAFELLDLIGSRHSLAQYRGHPVLLVFFNPDCGYCRELAPKLAAVAPHPVPLSVRRGDGGRSPSEGRLLLLILSTGDAEKNRQFFAEHKVGCTVLRQNDGEVAKAYQVNGTPAGYLVSAEGKILSELAMGAEALLKLASQPVPLTPALSTSEVERENASRGGDRRADRFGSRSLARSKIKRDGLRTGTPAPDFRLPRLDGRGELSLEELRGRRVLLVFSDPHCGPCNALAPELEKFHRRHTGTFPGEFLGLVVVMISRGDPKENRAKVKEYGLTFAVALQQQWEISRRYAMFATPVAYLIDETGMISHDVAIGPDAIRDLMAQAIRPRVEMQALAEAAP